MCMPIHRQGPPVLVNIFHKSPKVEKAPSNTRKTAQALTITSKSNCVMAL